MLSFFGDNCLFIFWEKSNATYHTRLIEYALKILAALSKGIFSTTDCVIKSRSIRFYSASQTKKKPPSLPSSKKKRGRKLYLSYYLINKLFKAC